MSKDPSAILPAPYLHRNWRAFLNRTHAKESREWPVYSDALFTGDLRDLGPYSVLNTISIPIYGRARPILVVRGGICADEHGDGNTRAVYHGDHHSNELVALLSLCFGVRLRAGAQSRMFTHGGDPLGTPTSFGDPIEYVLPQGPLRIPILARGPTNPVHLRDDVSSRRLRTLPQLDPGSAGCLIKSARLYQNALWVAEDDPSMAWMYLVSSIETAAGQWQRRRRSDVQNLKDSMPDLVRVLAACGGEAHVSAVAAKLAHLTGSTRKFLDFIDAFNPGPLAEPRMRQLAVDWSRLRELVAIVYKWRSQALHAGTPFPAPMCWAPLVVGRCRIDFPNEVDGAVAEVPIGFASGTGDAMWDHKDIPMQLHVFEHITRGALQLWWDSLVG